MGAGEIPYNASQKNCITRGKTAIVYLQRRAISCCTGQIMPASMPLVSFRDRRILFLQDNVRQLKLRPAFLPPYMACPVCDWEPQTGPPPKKSFITVFLSYFPRLRTPTQLGRERAARCYRRKPWTYFSVLMERRLRNRIETNDDIERNGGVKKNKVHTSVSRNKKILSRKESRSKRMVKNDMSICKEKGMGFRLIAILLCFVIMAGILPLQVFADEGDDGGETDTEIRVEASLCFTPSAKYYKEVPIVKNESCAPLLYVVSTNPMMPANELIVELYEENGGQEKIIGEMENVEVPTKRYLPFDWTPERSGDVTLGYRVKRMVDGALQVLYEGSTTVQVLAHDPDDLIPLHHRYESGDICGYLTGLELDGADVESSTIQSDSETACEIALVLKKSTQQNASFTLHTIVNRTTSCPSIGDNAAGATSDKRFLTNGFSVNLDQGAATLTFWAGSASRKMTKEYTVTFSIAQESTSGDPDPASVKALTVTTPPSAPYQVAGQKFDRAGMVVTATLTDDTTVPVVGYTVEPDGPLTLSNTKVTLRYGTVSVEFPITVRPRRSAMCRS